MRSFGALLVAAAAIIALPAVADAQDRAKKRKSYERDGGYARTTTQARDGTCLRDNGRPSGSLNLNNRCDREEFFARFNDFGGNRR